MKNKKKWWVIFCMLFSMTILFTGCVTTTTSSTTQTVAVATNEAVKEEQKEEITNTIDKTKEEFIEGKEFSLSVTCGYGGYAKYGRDMGVLATITNNGKDFVGDLWVLIPNNGSGSQSTLFKKEFAIAEGETKKVELAVPVLFSTGKLNISIRDKAEKARASLDVRVNVQGGNDDIYIGVLSDDYVGLSYLTDTKTKTFLMWELPENKKSLNMLDVIVINNFNTSILNENQYKTLKDFVKEGGTLVIGTGATATKTLQVFKDEFLTGKMEGTKTAQVKIGTSSKKMEKELLTITLDNNNYSYIEDNLLLMQKVNVGKGNIQLFTFDLGLENEVWNTSGKSILEKITEHLSDTKRSELDKENIAANYFSQVSNILEIASDNNVPNISKYSIALGIYLVLIGPLLYVVLKKLDKRNFMWVIVPAFSVIFSLVIYIMGTDTRLSKPYAQYVTFSNIQDGIESEELIFSLTAPYNNAYEVKVPAEYDVTLPVIEYYYGNYSYDKGSMEYDMSVGYGAEATTLGIRNHGAFEPAYFSASSIKDTESFIDSNISLKKGKDGEVSYVGTVTNNLGYNLESVILAVENHYFVLGDIKAGETKNIEKCDVYAIYSMDTLWKTDLMTIAVGGDPWLNINQNSDTRKIKQYYALEYKFRLDFEENLKENYILGFTEDSSNPVIDAIGLKNSGIKLVTTKVDLNYQTTENEIYVPCIDKHYTVAILNGDYEIQYRYIHSDVLELAVYFGKEEKITSLIYPKIGNAENDAKMIYDDGGYYGTIEAFNYEKGAYETIFESGIASTLTDVKPYLNEENMMRLQFDIDENARNMHSISVPVLAVTKEVD